MYQVVFTGRLLKGADRSTVEIELKRLFKATPRQVEWFLRGKAIVVKSCDDAVLAGMDKALREGVAQICADSGLTEETKDIFYYPPVAFEESCVAAVRDAATIRSRS